MCWRMILGQVLDEIVGPVGDWRAGGRKTGGRGGFEDLEGKRVRPLHNPFRCPCHHRSFWVVLDGVLAKRLCFWCM